MKVCVECGAIKSLDSVRNGWLSLWLSRCGGIQEFHMRHMEAADNSPEFEIVCGDNCAHRRYQKFLDYLRNTQA